MKYVHIIPIGEGREEVILGSMRGSGVPIQKAYFILEGRDKEECAERLEVVLRDLVETERVYVDGRDVYSTTLRILEVIMEEKKRGREVYVNISDVTRELCIACLISAQMSKSRVYGKNVLLLPPIKPLGDIKREIIRVIGDNGGEVGSINELVGLMGGRIEDERVHMAWRAKIHYHLRGLEEDNLVKTFKHGKHLRIQLTPWGKAYYILDKYR